MSEEMKNNMQEVNPEELDEVAGGAAGGHWISKHYHVTVNDLVRWNNIPNPRLILVGQKLRIYVR